jgi:zinc transport system substrate-binding protein
MKRKKKNIFFWCYKCLMIILVMFSFLSGCMPIKHPQGKPVIAVSILPQKFFVEKIAGDKYEIIVMIPPGSGHENYDPTPQQIIRLSKAIVYFKNGYLDFENNWVEKFLDNYPNLKFVNLSKKIDLIDSFETGRHRDAIEPHTWMSPVNVKKMAKSIYETLVEIDVKNESYYTDNYRQFLNDLDQLQATMMKKFQDITSNSFIIYHPALTYYARDFGLKQYSIEMDGKLPSAYHIRALIDIAKRENINAILVQKQYDKSKAEILANETGSSIIEIDPLNENWEQEMIDITNKLREAFNSSAKNE